MNSSKKRRWILKLLYHEDGGNIDQVGGQWTDLETGTVAFGIFPAYFLMR